MKPCQHAEIVDGCSICRVFATHDGYNRLWGGPGIAAPKGPCRHKGAETRRIECPTCAGKVELKVFACARHGECTPATRLAGLACCSECPDHEPIPPPIEWVSTARLAADAALLVGLVPPDASGIVGIPRSGMIPASIVAAHLQLPLFEMSPFGQLRPIGAGGRSSLGWAGDPTGPLVVIDDTAYHGWAMRRARAQLAGRKALFACVYPVQTATHLVDFYARVLPDFQLLEWNIFNNSPWAGIATDLDGVLCRDPHVPDADHGPGLSRYRQWLVNAFPLRLPRRLASPLIVTGRLERWRPETEAWLRRWGVRWDRLVMHPAATASERDRAGDVASIKAREFAASKCWFFLESDPWQAGEIHRGSSKPVVCTSDGRVWQ